MAGSRHVFLGLSLLFFVACAPTTRVASPVIQATPIVITPHDDETPDHKFDRARALLLEGKGRAAAPLFDQLADADLLAPASRYNAGIAWEQAGDLAAALQRFQNVAEHSREGELGRFAALRAARLFSYLERWSELSAMSERLMARVDLSDVERLEAYGAKALAVVESGDPEGAVRFIARGRDIIVALRLGEGGQLPLEVAQIHFALGEVRKQRSEKITFDPVPPNFAEVLEQRCQGLLDAQSAYSDAMRSYDAHWAAMSGYRVGQLYQRLHVDLLSIPVPTSAKTSESKRLFEGAMRQRYRVLLDKGLALMDHTLQIGERTGEVSAWIDRARASKREIEAALAEQKTLLSQLPYTERVLQQALDDLARGKQP